jgi:hypothetical protein
MENDKKKHGFNFAVHPAMHGIEGLSKVFRKMSLFAQILVKKVYRFFILIDLFYKMVYYISRGFSRNEMI